MVDKAAGVCVDSAKVHGIDHICRQYSLRDQAFLPLTPQGRPILVQASSSAPEITSAAKHSDAVFTAQGTIEEGPAVYPNPKSRAQSQRTQPEHGLVLPRLVTIIVGVAAKVQPGA